MNDEDITYPSQETVPAAESAPRPARTAGGGGILWPLIALLALGLAAWQWMETRGQLAETQFEMARRLAGSDTAASKSLELAEKAQGQLDSLQRRLGEVESRLAESKGQHEALEDLYQNLAHGSDESALAEVEQSVTLASQQLQLAGNVQGAVLALETASARLAENSQAEFINLRKMLARDLERLRALPQADIPGMYLRLGGTIESIDRLPLAARRRPRDESEAEPPVDLPPDWLSPEYWQALGINLWRGLRGVVRIERVDRAEPMLLPPGEEFFLRENIKLRLLGARLALFARDQRTFRDELRYTLGWVERYFDGGDKTVQGVLQTLRQFLATEIGVEELPTLNESLSAVRRSRAEKEH